MMLAMFNLITFAQDGRERVRFAKGKTSAELNRTVSADSGVITFIVNARKGQRMHFTVDSDVDDLGITLSEAGKQDFTLESGTVNRMNLSSKKQAIITLQLLIAQIRKPTLRFASALNK